MGKKKSKGSKSAQGVDASFVLDTQSADIPTDLSMAASTPPVDETTADETGLDLPGHVAFVTDADAEPAPVQDRDGDYDQLDAQGTRYYEAEANDERKRKGICPVCGEAGHEKKKCPYKQVRMASVLTLVSCVWCH